MNYRYEVTWDSDVDDPMNEGGEVQILARLLDIAEARQCMVAHRTRNSVMRL